MAGMRRVIDLYLSYKVKVSKNKVASLKTTGGIGDSRWLSLPSLPR